MNLRNSIASLAALSASQEVNASEPHPPAHRSEVIIGTEVNSHSAAIQGKYLHTLNPHFKAGGAIGIGSSYHGEPLGSAEAILSYGKHLTPKIGAAAEVSLGGEMIRAEGHNHIEPLAKLGAVGEIATGTHTKIYAGPYVGFTPNNIMLGGTAGIIIEL